MDMLRELSSVMLLVGVAAVGVGVLSLAAAALFPRRVVGFVFEDQLIPLPFRVMVIISGIISLCYLADGMRHETARELGQQSSLHGEPAR
jgi:hypothetical protein